MEALAVVFIILLIGIFGWMLIDRRWIDDWLGIKEYKEEPEREQAVIRMWPKRKTFDQEKQ